MAKILCAIRGGEASYQTQDAAIELAKKQEAELLYLFVFDIDFMDKTERAFRRDVITREMEHMAEFLLLMAVERANNQGVKSTMLIRHGNFREELTDVAKDPQISHLVLGRPADEKSFFTLEGLQELAKEIETKTQTTVIFAEYSVDE